MIAQSRRGFLTGLGALIAAPAIVRAANLTPVRGIVMATNPTIISHGAWWFADNDTFLLIDPPLARQLQDEITKTPDRDDLPIFRGEIGTWGGATIIEK